VRTKVSRTKGLTSLWVGLHSVCVPTRSHKSTIGTFTEVRLSRVLKRVVCLRQETEQGKDDASGSRGITCKSRQTGTGESDWTIILNF
jgi:hypothetical protein